jgi:hypothetical protein
VGLLNTTTQLRVRPVEVANLRGLLQWLLSS